MSSRLIKSVGRPQRRDTDWRLMLAELDEEGARIGLTVVDTPGFGDSIDNEPS